MASFSSHWKGTVFVAILFCTLACLNAANSITAVLSQTHEHVYPYNTTVLVLMACVPSIMG